MSGKEIRWEEINGRRCHGQRTIEILDCYRVKVRTVFSEDGRPGRGQGNFLSLGWKTIIEGGWTSSPTVWRCGKEKRIPTTFLLPIGVSGVSFSIYKSIAIHLSDQENNDFHTYFRLLMLATLSHLTTIGVFKVHESTAIHHSDRKNYVFNIDNGLLNHF